MRSQNVSGEIIFNKASDVFLLCAVFNKMDLSM